VNESGVEEVEGWPGLGQLALEGALREVRERMRGGFPAVWSPLVRRLADRDELLLAELARREPAVVAGAGRRRGPAVEVLAVVRALDVEALRAAELWRWLLEHWVV
jgi:hypothetical protein